MPKWYLTPEEDARIQAIFEGKTMPRFDELQRVDKRRMRAMALTSKIMQIVGKHVPYDRERDILRDISRDLQEAMERVGAEVVSDFDRQQWDLPPRGPDGWTMEEIVELETRRHEAMYATRPLTILAQS